MPNRTSSAPTAGLCLRCEHRARYHETGHGPRCECCQGGAHTVYGCYMYLPCKPVVVANRDPLNRPTFGPPIIAGRLSAVGLAQSARLALRVRDYDRAGGVVATWRVKPEPKPRKERKGAR